MPGDQDWYYDDTISPVDMLPAVSMVPFQRNPLFTGREEILWRLHDLLGRGTIAAISQAISGLGGVGKTQIAVEYACRYAREYKVILWMSADAQESVTSSFLAIATALQLPE